MNKDRKIFADVKAIVNKTEMSPAGEALRKALLDYEEAMMEKKSERELVEMLLLLAAALEVSEESFKSVIARLLLIFAKQDGKVEVVQVDRNEGGSGNVIH